MIGVSIGLHEEAVKHRPEQRQATVVTHAPIKVGIHHTCTCLMDNYNKRFNN